MRYSEILKKSYHLTIKNKILWFLGMMIGGGAVCNFGGYGTDFNDAKSIIAKNNASSSFDFSTILDYWYIIAIILLLILFLAVLFLVFSIMARGGLVYGINEAIQNRKVLFWDCCSFGFKKFWRVLGLQLFLGLIVSIEIIILSTGIALFVIIGMASPSTIAIIFSVIGGIIFSLLGLCSLIVTGLFLSLTINYIYCYLLLGDNKIIDSIKLGWKLFQKNIGDTLVLYLILMCIGFGTAIIYLMVIIAVLAIFTAFGLSAYFLIKWVGAVIVIFIGLITLFVIILFVKGIINVFNLSNWVYAWQELVDKK